MRRLLSRPLAALLAVAAGLAIPFVAGSPAEAAACAGAVGVTVVADFNSLGGGVQGTCVEDGGGDEADALFVAAGFPLSYASRQPGFVCRVAGVPTSDPCVNTAPADAYWALWWSDGRSGSWTYSSLGVSSLSVPDGGYVAFSFDDVAGDAQPSYDPVRRTAPSPGPGPGPTSGPGPTPGPGPAPTQQPSQDPTRPPATQPQPGGPGDAPEATGPPEPTAGATSGATSGPTTGPTSGPSAPATDASPTPSPTPSPTAPEPTPSAGGSPGSPTDPPVPGDDDVATELAEPAGATTEAADPDDGGVPGWVAPALIVVLFGAAGAVLLLRRRGTGHWSA